MKRWKYLALVLAGTGHPAQADDLQRQLLWLLQMEPLYLANVEITDWEAPRPEYWAISERNTWRSPSSDISPLQYDALIRSNRRLLERTVTRFLGDSLSSLGIPSAAQKFMGAAMVFAAQKGTKLYLNGSKTMFVELDDLDDDDRSVIYTYDHSW